ncbi:hypothetical protein BEP19_13115 [Ammoniphilus oxalaticus]|uniref:HTH marR-type domain-containing protein n=1 Tax=Ammoniphilus oxalaticus TaxID=66863 RepID=A0A419SH88_9BACL|nr:MarR family transcriptional regulator [Ammoniphilus oxalaticus]RKD23152.1 hypothetical protein BEP19_13115 [Ammoniphilus oxalaticus]
MLTNEQHLFGQFERVYWHLSKKLGSLWKQIFEERFPGSQSHMLFLLERNGAHKRMSELADALNLTPGAATTVADKLIENGYITRLRDQDDRRVVYLKITNKGKEAIRELQNEGSELMRLVFNDLSDADLTFFINCFERASRNIDDLRRGKNE